MADLTRFEILYRLSLELGSTLDAAHESAVFMRWLRKTVRPKLAALFLVDETRQYLDLTRRIGFKAHHSRLEMGLDPCRWLSEQSVAIPPADDPRWRALPIVVEGELLGLLAYCSRRQAGWEEEQRLAELAVGYLGPHLRNIQRYRDVERLVERRTAELSESEARFRTLSESALTGIYLIQDYLFRYVNRALAESFGYQVSEIIDRLAPLDLTHPDDRPIVAENIRRRVEGEELGIHYEFRGLRKDGSIFFVEVYGARIDYRGKPAVVGTLIDVTARKQAEQALRESEERQRIFINATQDLIFLKDDQLRYLIVNEANARYIGKPMEEIIGYDDFELMDAQNARSCRQTDLQALEQNKLVISIEKAGERSYETRKFPIQLPNGRIGVGGYIHDITEQLQAEQAQRESEARYRLISELISDYAYAFRVEEDQTLTREWIVGGFERITGFTPAESDARGG